MTIDSEWTEFRTRGMGRKFPGLGRNSTRQRQHSPSRSVLNFMRRTIVAILYGASLSFGGQPLLDVHGDPLPEGAVVRFGTCRYRIGANEKFVGSALSPDGKRIVVETPSDIMLWEIETGRVALRFPKADERDFGPSQFRFSTDGRTLIRTSNDYLQVFDIQTGKERCAKASRGWARCISFLPGEKQFALSFMGVKDLIVFDVDDGSQVTTLESQARVSLASTTGRFLLGERRSGFCVMDSTTGRIRYRLPRLLKSDSENQFALSDNCRVFAMHRSGRMRVFDAPAGTMLDEVDAPDNWGEPDTEIHLTISPDGAIAFLSKVGQKTLRRNVTARKWLLPMPVMPGGQLLPHSDNSQLFHAGDDGVLHRYDLTSLKEVRGQYGFDEAPLLSPSPDGKHVAIASGWIDGRVELFDLTGRLLWSVPHRGWTGYPRWSIDGRQIAFAGGDQATICDARTGKVVNAFRLTDKDQRFTGLVSFSDDGNRVIAAINNGTQVATFDLNGVKSLAIVRTGAQLVTDVSPDGRSMLFTNGSPSPALFDLETGRFRVDFMFPPPPRMGCGGGGIRRDGHWSRFSPDDSYGISWTKNGSALLWDPITGEPTGFFQTGADEPLAFAFSPDGLWLVTASSDGVATVLEVTSGQSLVSWQAHSGSILSVAFADKGRVLTGSDDLTALLWDMKPRKKLKIPAWDALSGNDALEAYRAIWAIADDPKGPDLLRTKIAPAKPAVAKQVKQWLADLGADKYSVRESATRELQALGRLIEPELKAARAKVTSEEVRMRLDALVAKILRERSGGEIVHARAVAAMELSGSDAAKKLLADWAAGAPGRD